MRGADCNEAEAGCGELVNAGVRRRDVPKLQGDRVDVRGGGRYLNGLREKLNGSWDMQGSVAKKWGVLKGALCYEAKAVLGYEDRKQPDWFRESEAALRSSIDERNRLYALWLSTGRARDSYEG